MRSILGTLFFLLFFSCSEKAGTVRFVSEKFEIETLTVEFNYTPRDIIQYKNGFLCRISPYHDDPFQLIYLDKKFNIDYTKTKELNNGLGNYIESIWTSGDTLFAISGLRNYEVRYRIKNNWVVTNTGSTNKENYMHHEKNLPIYEDDHFKVSSCCRGEFGGAVFFYDKKSKKTFSCPSTCLTSIQKFENDFYITSSLAHMGGHSSIIKIGDPRKLYQLKETQLNDCGWYDVYSEKPNEIRIDHPNGFDKGYKTIIDTFDLYINGSFEYKDHLYWICSDMKNSYVGNLYNRKIEILDTIYRKPMWLNEIRDIKHNSNIIPIRSREMKGMVILAGNKIKIVEFKSSNRH